MKEFRWSLLKSERLKKTRGVSFEDIVHSKLVAVKRHPGIEHQNILLFLHRGYIWVVPCVTNDDEVFLKTLYPSRKYTKIYRKGKIDETD